MRPCFKTGILLFLILLLAQPAHALPVSFSPNSLTWSSGDLTPKEVGLFAQGAWQITITGATGVFGFDITSGYGAAILTITPLSANATTTARQATATVNAGGSTATLTLTQNGISVQPQTDPWLTVANDLSNNKTWTQTTTVTSSDGSSYFRDISWYDGLGYVEQETAVKASTNGKSIVMPIVYDKMHHPDAKVYLPYAETLPTGLYQSGAPAQQALYYSPNTRPFSETVYGTSPSGRRLSWQREGQTAMAKNYQYRSNTAGDAIWQYHIAPGTTEASYMGVYPAGSLVCMETIGEHNEVSRVFTDALGRTVCTEQENDNAQIIRTFYVRDVRDSLTLVIQPEGVKALQALTVKSVSLLAESGTNSSITDKWCFVWLYDNKGNLLSEHVPGGGTTQYAYDARNRLVLQTDSRLSPSVGNTYKMIRTIYDQYDRVTSQYYVSSNVSITTLQGLSGSGSSYTLPSSVTSHLTNICQLSSATYFPFTSFTYPNTGTYSYSAESGFPSSPEKTRVRGLLQQETIYPAPNLDGTIPANAPSVTRAYHYDSRGRVIQTIEVWSDNWSRRISTNYSFTGDILAQKEKVITPGGANHTLLSEYTRDNRGRITSLARTLNGQSLRSVTYAYDDLGRMTGKTVGASSFLETTIGYDLHSWINDISLKKGSNNLFKETLRYSSPSRPGSVSPRYDGTLSETTVQHALSSGVTQSETWGYSYDKLSRLTDALHFNGSSTSSSNINTERDITYDFNGNITALKRYGPSGLANNLTFMLTGNRMSAVSDAVSSSNSGSYNYDSSGNQTQDGRQNLQIQWNIFNLASGAVTPNGSLTFARLSDGDRIFTKQVGTNTPAKRYCGSFLFSVSGNGAVELESVAWDEGRILYKPNQTQPYRDCWMAGDHLGNVRSVVDISPELTSAAILEQSDYTPFGTRLGISSIAGSRWRYAGKEEVRLHPGNVFSSTSGNPDLKLIDFGARLYDPFTARWTARDPMASKYSSIGTYVFCNSSPLNYIDQKGDSIIVSNRGVILCESRNDNNVFLMENNQLTKIGTLGSSINIDYIYSNYLKRSIKRARWMLPFVLHSRVKNKGEWDLKNSKRTIYGRAKETNTLLFFNGEYMTAEDLGNHHFGVVTKVNVFISEDFALRQAGHAQIAAGTSKEIWQNKKIMQQVLVSPTGYHMYVQTLIFDAPYGDDPEDQKWIKKGFNYITPLQ